MCMRAWILRVSHSISSVRDSTPQNTWNSCIVHQDNNRRSDTRLGNPKYSYFNPGSISFMNVMIDENKKYIAVYPIFMFYAFIAWFTLFI